MLLDAVTTGASDAQNIKSIRMKIKAARRLGEY
jgi:hypothetical protein